VTSAVHRTKIGDQRRRTHTGGLGGQSGPLRDGLNGKSVSQPGLQELGQGDITTDDK
jgi:hypothetical protein